MLFQFNDTVVQVSDLAFLVKGETREGYLLDKVFCNDSLDSGVASIEQASGFRRFLTLTPNVWVPGDDLLEDIEERNVEIVSFLLEALIRIERNETFRTF